MQLGVFCLFVCFLVYMQLNAINSMHGQMASRHHVVDSPFDRDL